MEKEKEEYNGVKIKEWNEKEDKED